MDLSCLLCLSILVGSDDSQSLPEYLCQIYKQYSITIKYRARLFLFCAICGILIQELVRLQIADIPNIVSPQRLSVYTGRAGSSFTQ